MIIIKKNLIRIRFIKKYQRIQPKKSQGNSEIKSSFNDEGGIKNLKTHKMVLGSDTKLCYYFYT